MEENPEVLDQSDQITEIVWVVTQIAQKKSGFILLKVTKFVFGYPLTNQKRTQKMNYQHINRDPHLVEATVEDIGIGQNGQAEK